MSKLFDDRRREMFRLKRLREQRGMSERESTYVCPVCNKEHEKSKLSENLYVCDACSYHFPVSAKRRIRQLVDRKTFREYTGILISSDPIAFPGYEEKLENNRLKTGNQDAIITGVGNIDGNKAVVIVLDSTFMMGSMGCVVGEEFTRAVEYAMKHGLPVVCVSASGGARMQEGMFSLMQMAKTSAAVEKFTEMGGFYLSVLTHPTMGGVSASFAMLGDVILAEPGALIGFAGPRVIEQTIHEKLPGGFQRAEFQLEHGFVDRVVTRKNLKKTIGMLLLMHTKTKR